jgi:hypothetical protein
VLPLGLQSRATRAGAEIKRFTFVARQRGQTGGSVSPKRTSFSNVSAQFDHR